MPPKRKGGSLPDRRGKKKKTRGKGKGSFGLGGKREASVACAGKSRTYFSRSGQEGGFSVRTKKGEAAFWWTIFRNFLEGKGAKVLLGSFRHQSCVKEENDLIPPKSKVSPTYCPRGRRGKSLKERRKRGKNCRMERDAAPHQGKKGHGLTRRVPETGGGW